MSDLIFSLCNLRLDENFRIVFKQALRFDMCLNFLNFSNLFKRNVNRFKRAGYTLSISHY